MARLPKPGEDSGVWGEILNDYLLASHNNDGTLKANSVTSSTLADNSVSASSLQASAGTNGQVLTYDSQLSGGLGWKDAAAPNATSSTKGVINLSGDLGGTADSPSVPALTNKLDKDAAGVAGGVATLDATGKIPISQLPVLETQDTIKKAQAALLPFRLALGNRRNSRSVIFVQGDSTDEGIGTNGNDRVRAWPTRLAAALRNSYGAPPETPDPSHPNFIPACSPSAMHHAGVTAWWGTARPPAGWTVDESRGPNGYALKADAAGSTLTLTIPASVAVTTYVLVYRRGPDSSYSFTTSLNGGASTANPTTGSLRDGTWTSLQNINGSSVNTVTITAGGDNTIVEGVILFGNNYNRGTVVVNGSKGGARTRDFLPVSRGGKGWLADVQTPTTESGAQALIDINPDLIIRGGFYNDMVYSGGYSSVEFKQYETDLIAGMRAVLPNKTIPVILLSKWKPDDAYMVNALSYGRTWESYISARDEIAANDPYCIHIDMSKYLPQPGSAAATALNMGYLDQVHGGDRVYGMIGDMMSEFLSTSA